jgi:hypothetical protein
MTAYRCFLLAVLLLAGSVAFLPAQSGNPYPPSATPDRILLSWSGDPATTQSVTWRTDGTVQPAVAEIAPADATPNFPDRAERIAATSTELVNQNNVAVYHTAIFTGLQPNTLYAYRVGGGEHWSEWFHFRTAADKPAPFSFLYFGDAQNDIKSLWSRCIRQAYSTLPDIDFLLHAGDLINAANSDREWGEWFYAGGWIYGMKPNLATPGNHEYRRDQNQERYLSDYWRPIFALPENGPDGLEETVYYVDYQGVRFISLNSQAMLNRADRLEAQRVWLEGVLQDNPQRWTIVTHHHPVYSTSMGRDNPTIRGVLQPLYEAYGVDLVLQGHDHSYGRGRNLQVGQTQLSEGPVYVVSVSGPKMYPLNFEEWEERVASNTQLYQLIHVDGKRLRFEAYTTTGQLYDAFELKKRRNGRNRFRDLAPNDVPEITTLPLRAREQMPEEQLELFRQRFQAYQERKGKE